MSISESSNLNRLLRLLTDVAPAAETQQLRASMREDDILKQQHDRLLRAMNRPFSLDSSLLHLDQVDPEYIAAFIDGTLSQTEATAFEKLCWNSDSLLREVAAGWRLEHQAKAAETMVRTQKVGSVGDGAMNEDAQSGGDGGIEMLRRLAEVPQIEAVSPAQQKRPVRGKKGQRGIVLGLATAALIAAMIVSAWKWIMPAGDIPGGTLPEQIVRQEKEVGEPVEQTVVQNADEVQPPQDNPPERPVLELEISPPEIKTPGDVLVDGGNGMPVPPQPEIQPPRGPESMLPPSQPSVNLAQWLDWSAVQGIAATRDAAGDTWKGIKVPSNYSYQESIPWVQVTTLSASQLKGEDERGAKWTAGANTSFRISQRAHSSDGGVVCDLESGRLAFENLAVGRTLHLVLDQKEYRFVVDEAGTTMVVHRSGGDAVFGVFRGSVNHDGKAINRRSWRAVDRTGQVGSFRPERLQAWYNQDVENTAPATLRDKFNNAPDFLAQIIDASQNGSPLEQTIGAQAILRIKAADQEAPSDATLRKMMGSPQEQIRAALIDWLAGQCVENPRFGMMMVQRVARLQSVPVTQAKSFQDWFAAHARGGQLNSTILNQLMGSLTTQSKPVVRQAAKFFLEDYLGEKIPYNPVKPGGNLNRVITEVRRMVTEKQRRSAR